MPANLLSRNQSNISLLAVGLLVMIFGSILSAVPIRAQTTYSVTINSVCNLGANDISFNTIAVPILQDGISTGYVTPHTFTGLIGVHNFTVPYQDTSGHIFRDWQANLTRQYFTTAYVSTDTIFWVDYGSDQFNVSSFTWNQYRFFITPSDPAVVAAAANKTYAEIINWVYANVKYNDTLAVGDRFPNETLALSQGVCRDFTHLCVSMLINRGYNAFVVAGTTIKPGDPAPPVGTVTHSWLVIEVNGVLYHVDPQFSLSNQPSTASWQLFVPWAFYNDQVFEPATASQDPSLMPMPTPPATPTPTPTPIPIQTPIVTPPQTPTPVPTPTATPAPTLALSSTSTPITTPPQTPMTTPTPQATTEPTPTQTIMGTPQETTKPTISEQTIHPTTSLESTKQNNSTNEKDTQPVELWILPITVIISALIAIIVVRKQVTIKRNI